MERLYTCMSPHLVNQWVGLNDGARGGRCPVSAVRVHSTASFGRLFVGVAPISFPYNRGLHSLVLET